MFSLLNSNFIKEINLYLKNGGRIKNLLPQNNQIRLSANTRIKEGEDEEIYFNELDPIFHSLFRSE